jgi:hypothetical protein
MFFAGRHKAAANSGIINSVPTDGRRPLQSCLRFAAYPKTFHDLDRQGLFDHALFHRGCGHDVRCVAASDHSPACARRGCSHNRQVGAANVGFVDGSEHYTWPVPTGLSGGPPVGASGSSALSDRGDGRSNRDELPRPRKGYLLRVRCHALAGVNVIAIPFMQ